MIYRKWSLLSGTAAVIGGIVGAVVLANLLFLKEDPFRKAIAKNQINVSSPK